MAFIINQPIGKYVYVYKVTSYWDKEKKQSRQKRELLGRRDLVTGKIIKTDRKRKNKISKIQDYGNVYFLTNLWKKLQLYEIVKSIYPEDYKSIIGLVNYVVSESKSYYLYSTWADYNFSVDLEKRLSSQRISELLNKLGDRNNKQEDFFQQWIKKQNEAEVFYFDITSLSTYSRELTLAECGYNRDKEKLRHINLGLIYGIKKELPLYYKTYTENISAVIKLKNIINNNKKYGIEGITYILDRGFFSRTNLKALEDEKVIIALPFSSKESKEILENSAQLLLNRRHLLSYGDSLYYYATGEKKIEGKVYQYYIFRDKERYNEQETIFLKQLIEIKKQVSKTIYKSADEVKEDIENISSGYSKFFKINEESGEYFAEERTEEVEKRIKRFGTFILITNLTNIKAEEILRFYRQRDRVEKVFDNMKNDLDRNRLRMSNENRVRGSLFITFLSLIIISHIDKKIRESEVLKNKTKQEIFYELKKIKVIIFEDGYHLVGEVSQMNKNIFKEFDISIPGE